jgi:rare lipoprotein A
MLHSTKLLGSCAGATVLGIIFLALPMSAEHPVPLGLVQPDNPREFKTPSEIGVASYYADRYHGRKTASGETFDMHALTAAHPTYRFGTRVKVTHLESQRSVVVRINDRGPFVKGRVIDLSLAAAEQLQMVRSGVAQVKLEILE